MSLEKLTEMMEEQNRSNYEIERHTRNSRTHLMAIKKSALWQQQSTLGIIGTLNSIFNLMTESAMFSREKSLEEQRRQSELLDALKKQKEAPPKKEKEKGPGLGRLGGMALAGALLAGISKSMLALGAAGVIATFDRAIGNWKILIKGVSGFIKRGLDFFTKDRWTGMIEKIKGTFRGAVTSADDAAKSFTAMIRGLIGRAGGMFSKALEVILSPFRRIIESRVAQSMIKWVSDVIDEFGKVTSWFRAQFAVFQEGSGPISRVMSSIRGLFAAVVEKFSAIFSSVKNFSGIIGKIATLASKIALPLTILMAAYEGIMGAWEGYQEEGWLGAAKGLVKGLFNGFIGGLTDMLINATAWLVEKMGFQNVAEKMREFSIQDLFSDIVDTIVNFVKDIPRLIKEHIKSQIAMIGDVGGFIEERFGNFVNAALPSWQDGADKAAGAWDKMTGWLPFGKDEEVKSSGQTLGQQSSAEIVAAGNSTNVTLMAMPAMIPQAPSNNTSVNNNSSQTVIMNPGMGHGDDVNRRVVYGLE